MIQSCSFFCYWAIAFLALSFAGCGSSPNGRLAAEGTVTYQGKPVNDGAIIFEPLNAGSRQANAAIENGEFRIPGEFGPTEGTYRVKIEGFRSTGETQNAGPLSQNEQVNVEESYIPAEFNSQSTLTIEVSESNARKMVFDLK